MRLAVAVAVHCDPDVARLTLGSLVMQHAGAHELSIHVGIHSNWRDYTDDTSLFDDLRGMAQIHLVDEIDWLSPQWNSCWWRYSAMHARNIRNVLRHARHEAFDRLLLIDHDVLFRGDLASSFMALGPDADLVAPLFDDRAVPVRVVHRHGPPAMWLPKVAAHHMLLSPRLVAAASAGGRRRSRPR